MDAVRQAVILAGGEGTRLRPLTDNTPKPMVAVNGRPFLEYLLELLKRNGITDVLLLLGYLPEKITDYFGYGERFGLKIRYSIGKVSDQTGTRLRNAAPLLENAFLLLYGDNYCPINLQKMLKSYNKRGVLASTTVYANKDGKGEYGAENNICVDTEGFVKNYDKSRKFADLNGVDIGFFILNKLALKKMPEGDISFEERLLPLLAQERQLSAFVTEHRYHYISNPASLAVTAEYLLPKKVILLDRDGVINKKRAEGDYVKNWNEFEFLTGSAEAISRLTASGYDIYVVTNQRGIARGLMTEQDLKEIHANMKCELEKTGGVIKQIYHCPHNDEEGCLCRKPKPGMLFRAASENDFDLTKAIFVGDDKRDSKAGEAADCPVMMTTKSRGLLGIAESLLK